MRAQRPEEAFAYLTLGDAHLMLQQADGPGRRFRTAPLEQPFGRGINLQILVADIEALWASVRNTDLDIVIPLEDRRYRQNDDDIDVAQFVVADRDGYLLRFQQLLDRSATRSDA